MDIEKSQSKTTKADLALTQQGQLTAG